MGKAEDFLTERLKTTNEVSKDKYYVWVKHSDAITSIRLAKEEGHRQEFKEIQEHLKIVGYKMKIKIKGKPEIIFVLPDKPYELPRVNKVVKFAYPDPENSEAYSKKGFFECKDEDIEYMEHTPTYLMNAKRFLFLVEERKMKRTRYNIIGEGV